MDLDATLITLRAGSRRGAHLAVVLVAVLVAACSPAVIKHGHQFQEADAQQISPGMSQEQVRTTLGTPTTTASVGTGNAYYYISSTMSQSVAFLDPKEVDRQVLAVYFTPSGSVERVAHYGIKDGKVFDFVSRTTPPANTREEGIFRQLFRNIGQKNNVFTNE